jgi:hypothetical protein
MNGTSINLACLGNTSGCAYGNYTLTVYCQPSGVGEAANNFTYSTTLTISIVGDLTGPNGVPDGKVDIRDVHYVAMYYGTTLSSPNWNPNADINNDGKIDIRDVHLAAVNYGQHYP